MGLIDGLKQMRPRLPRPFRVPTRMYRAFVTAEGHDPHAFVYVDGPAWDEPAIIANEHRFIMPDDPTFIEREVGTTTFQGDSVPLHVIEAAYADDAGGQDHVTIPSAFQGATIPVVERSKEELRALSQ